jgi:rhodanese-related sulfurtransferase
MAEGTAPVVVDVRTGIEFRGGHIPDALHAPTWKIALGLVSLPPDRQTEMVVLCELGPRAMMAQTLLAARGYRNTSLLDGHMAGWRRAGHPVTKG